MCSPVHVKKIGVRLKPPTIILVYEEEEKVRQRDMPIRGLFKNSSVGIIARELKTRHDHYLSTVPLYRLEKLIRIIQETMKGKVLEESLGIVNKEFGVDPDEDLNKLDEDTVKRKKAIMDTTFERNRKKPGDDDFRYEVEVDFDNVAVETSAWDSENDFEF